MAYKLIKVDTGYGLQHHVQVLDPIKNTPFSWLLIRVMRFLEFS